MKKIFFLLVIAIVITTITNCGKKTTHIPQQKTVETCPFQMANFNTETLTNFQLTQERLVGSKVSISNDIELEIPTSHELDNGRHKFLKMGNLLRSGSVGIITNTFDGDLPKTVQVLFEDFSNDSLKINCFFEIDNKSFKNEFSKDKLIKKSDLDAKTIQTLASKGYTLDKDGYLKKGNFFFEVKDGKPSPVGYPSSTSNSVSKKYKLIHAEMHGKIYKIKETNLVYLDQIKFRVCSEFKEIKTGSFDDPVEKGTKGDPPQKTKIKL